jgi:DNA-binding LacI/PurR family transcriptional regulator
VSVVGFDDVAMAAYVDPPLTTIAQRTDVMGRWAIDRLLAAMRPTTDGAAPSDENGAPTSVRLPVDLRVRGSTGPAPTDAPSTI